MSKAAGKLEFLHLEAEYVVVNKPAGVLSIEAPGRDPRRSVVLRAQEELDRRGEDPEVYAVHRLDEETTGALVLARTPGARTYFESLFAEHRIERVYHAIVLGRPHPRTGRIEGRVVTDARGVVHASADVGELAILDYATVHEAPGTSVVACRLETGRRNQIRVQLAERGCPVVGDRKYGRFDRRFRRVPAPRTMLHATALGFVPPGAGDARVFLAPFPDDFQDLLGEEVLQKLRMD